MQQSDWILLGEDDPNDALLTKRALLEADLPHKVVHARDGVEVLDCLLRRGTFATRIPGNPALVLLDLKMPRVDGQEVLETINDYLFAELGFSGNEKNYYDPENSYLNRVLDRRTGNPINLCFSTCCWHGD